MLVKPNIMCPWTLERELQLDKTPTVMKALPWIAAILVFDNFTSCNRNDSDISIGRESAATFLRAIVLFAIVLKLLPYDCTSYIVLSLKFLNNIWEPSHFSLSMSRSLQNMSHSLSEQTEVRPNESISQVSAFAVNENEESEEDIYGEPFSVPPGSSSEFRSRNSKAYPAVTHLAHCLSLLAGYFKMTLETVNKGKRFLKVFTTRVI